jgi:PmbA protein
MKANLDPLDLAAHLVERARALGADEVTVGVTEGTSVQLTRRDGKLEQASEASTRRVQLSLLVEDRYSSHATSDLRPEAVERFLARAVAATRYLEPDPDRALPDRALCGRGATEAALDHHDPSYASYAADDRAALAEQLEAAVRARADERFISASTFVADGASRFAQATSHGFADRSESTWYQHGADITLSDGDRRPEGAAYYAACYRADMPEVQHVAEVAHERAQETIGAGPIASGRYPMLLANHAAPRILGVLGGPMSGYAIHHQRSCLADKLGERIGSDLLHLIDDPRIPRGLGSTPWDDDLLVARPRTMIEHGVLQAHYLDVYHARKLGRAPTTGSRTNWVLQPGVRTWQDLARELPKAILVTGFLGGNANSLTGDFSFGIRGRLLEHGEPTASLGEMNVAGNTLRIFHQLGAVANDPWIWSSVRSPTLLFHDVQFSGT